MARRRSPATDLGASEDLDRLRAKIEFYKGEESLALRSLGKRLAGVAKVCERLGHEPVVNFLASACHTVLLDFSELLTDPTEGRQVTVASIDTDTEFGEWQVRHWDYLFDLLGFQSITEADKVRIIQDQSAEFDIEIPGVLITNRDYDGLKSFKRKPRTNLEAESVFVSDLVLADEASGDVWRPVVERYLFFSKRQQPKALYFMELMPAQE